MQVLMICRIPGEVKSAIFTTSALFLPSFKEDHRDCMHSSVRSMQA